MITSVALFPLLGCSLLLANVAVSFAAPATYDQRQDGRVNLAANVENVLVVVAMPAKKSYSDALEAYLIHAMNDRNNDGHSTSAENESVSAEMETEDPNPTSSSSNEEDAIEDGSGLSARPARSLPPAHLDDESPKTLFDNELPGDQNREKIRYGEQNNSDIDSLNDSSLRLIGDGIEDCGPGRRRDSYGICQPWLNE